MAGWRGEKGLWVRCGTVRVPIYRLGVESSPTMEKVLASTRSLAQIVAQIGSTQTRPSNKKFSQASGASGSPAGGTQAWPSTSILTGPERFGAAPGATVALQRKTAARAALVGMNEPARALLTECFRQFGIDTQAVSNDAAERLHKEKFEACVLTLNENSEPVLEAARSSRSNGRCVIYGVGGTARDALKYSKYGINAMFAEPLERPAMLKLVRATKMLVLHEYRRYVRIPIITEVAIIGEGKRVSATSVEMSSGGMSLHCSENFFSGENVELSFALMNLPRLNLRGAVSWSKPKSLGVRFDPADQKRMKLKTWIDSYLEN
jgi:Tfp pilus assembly protein PilZ